MSSSVIPVSSNRRLAASMSFMPLLIEMLDVKELSRGIQEQSCVVISSWPLSHFPFPRSARNWPILARFVTLSITKSQDEYRWIFVAIKSLIMAIFRSLFRSLEFSEVFIVHSGQCIFLASDRYDVKSASGFSAFKVITNDGAFVSLLASL